MKLLIVTQKVDQSDAFLGFFHSWIVQFAKHFGVVTVICLEEGQHELPSNVKVMTLGKGGGSRKNEERRTENGGNRLTYIFNFYKYIWRERNNYDAVFVHMNPIYVVLGGPLWKMWGKRIGLWYVHRSVDLKLRIAGMLTGVIYTASPESCRLKSAKINVVGHGIDTQRFAGVMRSTRIPGDSIEIIHVGRITKIKNCDTLIAAAHILKSSNQKSYTFTFVGDTVTEEDRAYKKHLEETIRKLNLETIVTFAGPVPNPRVESVYTHADAAVNLTRQEALIKQS